MRKTTVLGLLLVLALALLAACGGDDDGASSSSSSSQPAASSSQKAPSGGGITLEQYAADHAGGVGAIYVGDLKQLVGPAATVDQGDFDGNVPLSALENHIWVYESDFYKKALEKANLTNPTPLTSEGVSIQIQHACINRALGPCKVLDSILSPNIKERTNGQLEFVVSSFPELGLAGPDTLSLVASGTLESATIYAGYVSGEMPPIEIQNLWGLYDSLEQEFKANELIVDDIEKIVLAETGGVVMNHHLFSGNDQYFFCKDKVDSLDDFKGKKTRSHSAALSDWIEGMGASAQFVAFAEVYTALERGILDCGVTGADASHGQRWYEVTNYMIGPLISWPFVNNVINAEKWNSIPADLQNILMEEAAKSELEALRIGSIQNEMGLIKNQKEGLEFIPFSEAMADQSLNGAVMERVVPNWVKRVGSGTHPVITDIFNPKIGPLVGLKIEADGSVTKTK
jgi:TRAP-type C4-dicarboxylate transport system substrate-binding protein